MDDPTIVNIAKKVCVRIQSAEHYSDSCIVKQLGREPAQVLLRWSLQHGYIPLVRSSNPERISSNAQLYDFELSGEDMKALDSLDQGDAGAIAWNPIHTE